MFAAERFTSPQNHLLSQNFGFTTDPSPFTAPAYLPWPRVCRGVGIRAFPFSAPKICTAKGSTSLYWPCSNHSDARCTMKRLCPDASHQVPPSSYSGFAFQARTAFRQLPLRVCCCVLYLVFALKSTSLQLRLGDRLRSRNSTSCVRAYGSRVL